MGIKIASRERKLQSPEGSFVSFEKFVFVKTQAVRGLKEHESCESNEWGLYLKQAIRLKSI